MTQPTRPVNPDAAEAVAAAVAAGADSLDAIAARLGQPNSPALLDLCAAMAVQGWFCMDDAGIYQLRDRTQPITSDEMAASIVTAARRGARSSAEVAAAIGQPLTPPFNLIIGQVLYERALR